MANGGNAEETPHPFSGHAAGLTKDHVEFGINRFIAPPPPDEPPAAPEAAPESVPDRYYVQLSQTEFRPGPGAARAQGGARVWFFDGFSADWFDSQHEILPDANWENAGWEDYFLQARVFVIEVEIPVERLESGALPSEASFHIHKADQQGEEPQEWFELRLQNIGQAATGPRQIRVQVYPNLYEEGINAVLTSLGPVPEPEGILLDRAANIDHLALKDPEPEVANALSALPADWVVVYDVGQGNAIGICDPDGKVACYCDLGGGVMGNRKTFPTALNQFCFHRQPPVVLTHWDFDHWSSANLAGGQASWHSTWIAPRQRPLGASHHTLMRQIRRYGKLLLLPASFRAGWRGRFHLERCTGRGRNHSGLALTLARQPNGAGERILFPGDSCYDHITTFQGSSYLSVVVPHHGGDMKSATTPLKPSQPAARSVYSYGPMNTFKHPRNVTRRNHHRAGWRDPHATRLRITPPYEARNTAERLLTRLGHVLLSWNPVTRIPPLCCSTAGCGCDSSGQRCDLEGQQL